MSAVGSSRGPSFAAAPLRSTLAIRARRGLAAGCLLACDAARAHLPPGLAAPGAAAPMTGGLADWSFEPWTTGLMATSAIAYAIGLVRLWRRAGVGRGIRRREAVYFAAGWLTLVVALLSPLDPLGVSLFSAHMLQHELLMIVAAPLMVLARPLAAWTWALPLVARRFVGRCVAGRGFAAAWRLLTGALAAWLLHALALWAWHVPALFERALVDDAVHTAQHASFLVTALLFWWAVLGRPGRSAPLGASLLYLFGTMMHSSLLGALLTFSPTVWFPTYVARSAAFGLHPIEDQQLGGLIMWVPGGLAYLVAALAIAAAALARARPVDRISGPPPDAARTAPRASRSPRPTATARRRPPRRPGAAAWTRRRSAR